MSFAELSNEVRFVLPANVTDDLVDRVIGVSKPRYCFSDTAGIDPLAHCVPGRLFDFGRNIGWCPVYRCGHILQ